ncbi:glycoside hydrolase family protein [Azospirillum formosense]|uniref:Lysozyme n=1 Tax=Azospirillum formosense TaxID=861533 RepID=A0ABX2KZQ5_9PROT|nr:lysozyme [Azospirillum formosense]NUB18405.1 glycoside hydrolase family protein [Azospirillum formosense]
MSTIPALHPDTTGLVQHFEGLKLSAYRCPAGVWTIGYGHTKGVREGEVITAAVAERLLASDLAAAAADVAKLVTVPLTDAQRGALASFVFNLGAGAFKGSTLLRLLNQGDIEGAAGQFERWVYATVKGKKVKLPGLVTRRAAEEALFRGGDWRAAVPAGAAPAPIAQKVEAAPVPVPLVRSAPALAGTATLGLGTVAALLDALGPVGDVGAQAVGLAQQVAGTAAQVQAVAEQVATAQGQVAGAVAAVQAIGAGPSVSTLLLGGGLLVTLGLQVWERLRSSR